MIGEITHLPQDASLADDDRSIDVGRVREDRPRFLEVFGYLIVSPAFEPALREATLRVCRFDVGSNSLEINTFIRLIHTAGEGVRAHHCEREPPGRPEPVRGQSRASGPAVKRLWRQWGGECNAHRIGIVGHHDRRCSSADQLATVAKVVTDRFGESVVTRDEGGEDTLWIVAFDASQSPEYVGYLRSKRGRRVTERHRAFIALGALDPVLERRDPVFEAVDAGLRALAVCNGVGSAFGFGFDAPLEVIHLVGGGARNELLCQWTADATGRRVVAGPAEATALGNLLIQARAMDGLPDDTPIRDVVRASTTLRTYDPAATSPLRD